MQENKRYLVLTTNNITVLPESVFINSLIQFLFNHHSAPELFHTALGSLVPDPRVKALRGTAKD